MREIIYHIYIYLSWSSNQDNTTYDTSNKHNAKIQVYNYKPVNFLRQKIIAGEEEAPWTTSLYITEESISDKHKSTPLTFVQVLSSYTRIQLNEIFWMSR